MFYLTTRYNNSPKNLHSNRIFSLPFMLSQINYQTNEPLPQNQPLTECRTMWSIIWDHSAAYSAARVELSSDNELEVSTNLHILFTPFHIINVTSIKIVCYVPYGTWGPHFGSSGSIPFHQLNLTGSVEDKNI